MGYRAGVGKLPMMGAWGNGMVHITSITNVRKA